MEQSPLAAAAAAAAAVAGVPQNCCSENFENS